MRFLLFVSFLILISSCSDLKKPGQIERIDELIATIDSATEELKENTIENAEELMATSTELVNEIKSLEDDTIQMETALKFDRFKLMYDDLAPTLAHYDELLESVQAEKKVLMKLKNDINHGHGKRHKYDEYLSFEEKKVTELESAITLYVERKKVISTTYDELYNEINDLLVERFGESEVQ